MHVHASGALSLDRDVAVLVGAARERGLEDPLARMVCGLADGGVVFSARHGGPPETGARHGDTRTPR